MPTELFCSIVLAGRDQIDKGLEGLHHPAKSAGNPGRDLMWMRDCSGEWFRLEPLRKMIARMISKASTHWTNNWPTNQTNQLIKLTIDQLINQVIKNDGFARPRDFSKSQKQLRNDWLNNYDYGQYCKWYWMRSRVGRRSESGARGLKPAKGQEPTAEALKIQKVNIGR